MEKCLQRSLFVMNSPRFQVALLSPFHSLVCLVFLNPPPDDNHGDHSDMPCLSTFLKPPPGDKHGDKYDLSCLSKSTSW